MRKWLPHPAHPPQKSRLKRALGSAGQIVLTFVLVCFAWVFFRANSLPDAIYGLSHMFDGIGSPASYFQEAALQLGIDRYDLVVRLFPVALLAVFDAFNRRGDALASISRWSPVFRWAVYLALVWFILFFPGAGSGAEFIYFQF